MARHAHVLIAGATLTGKSSLAREIARAQYAARDVGVIVLDPFLTPGWPADVMYDQAEDFLVAAKGSWQCALFIDEASGYVGHYDREMHWCATQARHLGHRAHFIVQRPTQVPPVVRDQCSLWYLFRLSHNTAKTLADDAAMPQVLACAELTGHEYLVVDLLTRKTKKMPNRGHPAAR
ncbi:MAG: ATP-binding protein [Gammaproteobacteria bacterium]|nr:ATP-binding protein [Gammaproteobacteria bacterium]NIR97954.1 ATP-binding protein [Gammaproteobacteria bacterium]NIT63655.1 ATP-binding protein [Gammaproteobacteria bacterium]NIV21513.1 hypothetical protein [Gammaproteobacteria bacterium]NIY32235.1 hypothetical protein [Gammaproteobacteria bacterium]